MKNKSSTRPVWMSCIKTCPQASVPDNTFKRRTSLRAGVCRYLQSAYGPVFISSSKLTVIAWLMVFSPCTNSSSDQTSVTSNLPKIAKETQSRTRGALSSLTVIREHLGESQWNGKMWFYPSRRARGSGDGCMMGIHWACPPKTLGDAAEIKREDKTLKKCICENTKENI